MKFLVEQEFAFPEALGSERFDQILAEERERGHELRELGHIERIFRLPGRTANVGIWEALDADVLHALLTSLPARPYLTSVRVQALATHPLESD